MNSGIMTFKISSDPWDFRIYGKEKNKPKARFKPFNGRDGFCINLISAAIYPADKIDKVLEELNRENPEFTFEKRAI